MSEHDIQSRRLSAGRGSSGADGLSNKLIGGSSAQFSNQALAEVYEFDEHKIERFVDEKAEELIN